MLLQLGAHWSSGAPGRVQGVFARIVRYAVEPARCEEALAAFREAAEEIGDIDGISGGYVMVDGDDGLIVTVTLWENRAAMENSEVRASRLRQEALRSVDGEIQSVERVSVATTIGATASIRP
jgi:heme-degrading monooxygenase HmoA